MDGSSGSRTCAPGELIVIFVDRYESLVGLLEIVLKYMVQSCRLEISSSRA